MAAQLTATLPNTGGTNYIYLFAHYVVATQERATAEEFIEIVQQTRQEIGDEMTTLAQEWLEEGKLEGKIEGKIEGKREGKLEGKVEMIENLLQMQMDWAFIEEATGVNEETYAELRQQLAQLQQAGIQASDQSGAG